MSASRDFFSELRRLAVSVQNEATMVQQDLHKPPTEGAAEMVLYNLHTEVRGLLDSAKTEYNRIQKEDGGFLEAAALVGTLLEKQKQAMTETEKYLQKYGYTPIGSTANPPKASSAAVAQNTTATSQNTADTSQQREIAPKTPEKTVATQAVDLDRTPKLEDYGLSADFYKRWQKPKATTPPAPTTAPAPQSSANMDGDEPEEFRHTGLYVTPGMMGGRHVSHITPLKGQRVPTLGLHDTPEPPVFTTPALNRQLRHTQQQHQQQQQQQQQQQGKEMSDNTPEPPLLQTPGLKKLVKPPTHSHSPPNYETKDNTPDYPQFCTPGFGIQKPATQNTQQPVPKFSLSEQGEDVSPEPHPKPMTFPVGHLSDTPEPPKLLTMNLRTFMPPRAPAPPAPTPAPEPVNVAPTTAPASAPTPAPAPAPEPVNVAPAAPAKVEARLVAPSYQQYHDANDIATPEAPVLTTRLQDLQGYLPEGKTLNFSSLGQSVPPPATHTVLSSMPEKSKPAEEKVEKKETDQDIPTPHEVIRAVSMGEYQALQQSVRRKVTLPQLNTVIARLNRYIDIATNIEGCGEEEVELCVDNFKEECGGCNALMMFMVLQCLHRVKATAATSKVYRIVKIQ